MGTISQVTGTITVGDTQEKVIAAYYCELGEKATQEQPAADDNVHLTSVWCADSDNLLNIDQISGKDQQKLIEAAIIQERENHEG